MLPLQARLRPARLPALLEEQEQEQEQVARAQGPPRRPVQGSAQGPVQELAWRPVQGQALP
ncbi:hypothetical protein SMD20_46335 [Nonomuraea sp. LP-02]|uniref:hypothetical protein n=1 Tax=Nonomuraea sp. LP-02 TaxID=3097960 RepID=UPI002E347F89|nr:hypothetical protein [Nonomuraea sp. LP-02]MED7931708.1 hypothetical protein [Nonomuraea sp. LP-02]